MMYMLLQLANSKLYEVGLPGVISILQIIKSRYKVYTKNTRLFIEPYHMGKENLNYCDFAISFM